MRLVAVLAAFLTACGSAPPAAPDAGAEADAGPPLPFMATCVLGQDEQCETGLCFDFSAKGPHCTHACAVDADCEAPSPGCNGMGVCKAPGGGTGGGTGP